MDKYVKNELYGLAKAQMIHTQWMQLIDVLDDRSCNIIVFAHQWFIIVVFLSFDVVAFAFREVQFKCINCLWRPRTRSYSTSLPQRVEIGGRQSWKPVVRTALLCSKDEPEEQIGLTLLGIIQNLEKIPLFELQGFKLQCLHSKEAFVL